MMIEPPFNNTIDNIVLLCLIVLMVIGVIGKQFTNYIKKRNSRVFQFQMKILAQIEKLEKVDILYNRDSTWRYEMWNKVSYEKMLYSLKPLKIESFYKDTTFLK